MSWVNGFYAWLFGVRPQSSLKGSNAGDASAGLDAGRPASQKPSGASAHQKDASRPLEEHLYEGWTEAGVDHAKQHHWLFDEGVLHWNERRGEQKFKPYFAGVNFLKAAAKTRLWGCPSDLAGPERVVLSGIDLKFADLQGSTLTRADLRHANLRGANLRNANLASANFENADLSDCDLRGAVLDGADFSRAKLVSANLSGASVKGANLAWANVSHMIACSDHLRDTNMFGVYREDFSVDAMARIQVAAVGA